MNGPIYQLHPTSVIQIPVATKETNAQTANNIVVNNGYFINGAFIKLQQMLTQQQVHYLYERIYENNKKKKNKL